ncbi:unnamed protein product [Discosporangium mesarthrocarpum]
MALRRSLLALRPRTSTCSTSRKRIEGVVPSRVAPGKGTLQHCRGPGGVDPPGGSAAVGTGTGVRHLGVMDTIQDKMIDRRANKEAKKFKEHMRNLAEQEKYDLNDFAKMIEEPLNSWAAKVPGLGPKEELENLRMAKSVIDALSPLQKGSPELIKAPDKLKVASKAGCSEEQVHQVLAQYREASTMHRWLRARKAKGQRIPKTQEELSMMATDPGGITLAKFMKMKKKGGGMPTMSF